MATSSVPCTVNTGQVISCSRSMMSSRLMRAPPAQISCWRSRASQTGIHSFPSASSPKMRPAVMAKTSDCLSASLCSKTWSIPRYPSMVSGSSRSAVESMSTSARTRSGAVRAALIDRKPPCDIPVNTADSMPRWSRSAIASFAESQ